MPDEHRRPVGSRPLPEVRGCNHGDVVDGSTALQLRPQFEKRAGGILGVLQRTFVQTPRRGSGHGDCEVGGDHEGEFAEQPRLRSRDPTSANNGDQ